jgi:hypothetical protein
MGQRTTAVASDELRSVERFLEGLPYVQAATVWLSNGRMLAHVTVLGEAPVVSNTFRAACLRELGVHRTPEEVYLIVDRELVA